MDILLGLQWGDEGKGKIVDFLAPKYDVVARFQGGPNAGHTLFFDGLKHVLHQIPSGIFRPTIQNVVGNGVVLDAVILKKEIEALQKLDVDVKKSLFFSKKAQLILPTHRILDAAQEKAKGNNKIGSTLKGISPTYQDKIGRSGLRLGDALYPNFKERYEAIKAKHLEKLNNLNPEENDLPSDFADIENTFFEAIEFLKDFKMIESEYFIDDAIKANKKVLAEGAQGTLLDIDFGSYPFVTSSNTVSAGACTGLGVAPSKVKEVFGIFKAYCTRVGSGPFPTELEDETGEALRKFGGEFGATTGRPRRCGWLDLPALNYAVMINGVTQLFMMKTDVLTPFDEIKVCTHYKLEDGTITDRLPHDLVTQNIEPIYKTFEGWEEIAEGITSFEQLPKNLQAYIKFIEENVGAEITLVSFGPERNATLMRNELQTV
ncbi:adenylosuccinate synthase [Bernardetia sp.]|uniref:adenylosuccinate synthase n=1 Tax=Bernardetia sp. TaxID=1937974 RepID=UPI0025BC1596|nr:adenylosuccinate synthase [Bernardetia sp.]